MSDTSALAESRKAELERAYRILLGDEPVPYTADPEQVSRAIVERIMRAETFDEVFGPQDLPAWRELEGVPVKVRDVRLNPSSYDGGPAVYAVVDIVRLDTGEELTVTCGGRNVMVQLLKAVQMGWLDRPVTLVSRRTREGYSALWLESAENPLDDV